MEIEQAVPPRLRGEYEPLSMLKGGEGRQTLLLRHRATRRQVVLKCCRDGREDLAEEFGLLGQLAGEGLPAPLDYFREGGAGFLLREYVPGETLLDYAQKRGPLPDREVRDMGLALCRVLKRLHGQQPPVIHRDIKLENIIRTPEGKLVLIDLGIARRYDRQARRDTQVLGTPASAPPEQFGYGQTDPRSDVYALGAALHELSTGELGLERGRKSSLRAVIRRCTRFDPADRYADAAQVEQALLKLAHPRRVLLWLIPLAAVALAAVALWFGRPGSVPEPPVMETGTPALPGAYEFASPAIEAEVCRQLGKEPGTVTAADLERIDSLILCGDRWGTDWSRLSGTGAQLLLDGAEVAEPGTVDTLEDIAAMKNLRTLALCEQQIEDLSPLAECGQLQWLSLHGNQITDLSPIAACEQLQELVVSDNPVSDFSALAACPYLWSVDAGATGVTDLEDFRALPALYRLSLHDAAGLRDISALEDTGIKTLFLRPVSREQLGVIGRMTQLRWLFLWSVEGMENLTPLSGLTELSSLYIHSNSITSLDGVEAMAGLTSLDVRSDQTLDLTPLTRLDALATLFVYGLEPADWAVLGELSGLTQVYCTPEQGEAIRQAVEQPGFLLNTEEGAG